jgi:hypothetical protein
MEHVSARPKDVLIHAAHTIATVTPMNSGKIKKAMNISIRVGEEESVMLSVSLQSIQKVDEVGIRRQTWTN